MELRKEEQEYLKTIKLLSEEDARKKLKRKRKCSPELQYFLLSEVPYVFKVIIEKWGNVEYLEPIFENEKITTNSQYFANNKYHGISTDLDELILSVLKKYPKNAKFFSLSKNAFLEYTKKEENLENLVKYSPKHFRLYVRNPGSNKVSPMNERFTEDTFNLLFKYHKKKLENFDIVSIMGKQEFKDLCRSNAFKVYELLSSFKSIMTIERRSMAKQFIESSEVSIKIFYPKLLRYFEGKKEVIEWFEMTEKPYSQNNHKESISILSERIQILGKSSIEYEIKEEFLKFLGKDSLEDVDCIFKSIESQRKIVQEESLREIRETVGLKHFHPFVIQMRSYDRLNSFYKNYNNIVTWSHLEKYLGVTPLFKVLNFLYESDIFRNIKGDGDKLNKEWQKILLDSRIVLSPSNGRKIIESLGKENLDEEFLKKAFEQDLFSPSNLVDLERGEYIDKKLYDELFNIEKRKVNHLTVKEEIEKVSKEIIENTGDLDKLIKKHAKLEMLQ